MKYMQRINAKSQAARGEAALRRGCSLPIAPTRTTPAPTGESIANSAAIWRRGINVRLFECSDCSIGSSGAEEVVEGHFGLDDAGVLVAFNTVGRDKGDMTVPCLRIIGLEGRDLVAERLRVIGLNRKLRFRELHLTKIGHAVATTDNEVDLCTRIVRPLPRCRQADNSVSIIPQLVDLEKYEAEQFFTEE